MKTIKLHALVFLFILSANCIAQATQFNQKINSDFRNVLEGLGNELAIWNNFLFVASSDDAFDSTNSNSVQASGSVHIFIKNNNKWVLHQKINAPLNEREPFDFLGWSMDVDNGYLVIGAHQQDLDENSIDTLTNSGAVYIFKLNSASGLWLYHQKIVPSDREPYDNFGTSVSISGNQIAVGSPIEDHDENGLNFINAAGSVYIFELSGGQWVETQKIVSNDRRAQDLLGTSVSLSQNRLIVGCDGTDYDNSNTFLNAAGAFYYFEKDGNGIWQQIQKITPVNRYAGDNFGDMVLLKDSIAVIGAYKHDLDISGSSLMADAGAIYVFDLDTMNHWQERQKIVHSDRQADDWLGRAFDFNEDFLITGVQYQDFDENGANSLNWAGAAYVYELDTLGLFSFENKIVAPNRTVVDLLGNAVAVDGLNFIAGATRQDYDSLGNNYVDASGAVYINKHCSQRTYKNVRICNGDSVFLDGQYRGKSGVFNEIFTNSSSCDSIVTTRLMVDTFNLTVNQSPDTLFAKLSNGAYQWYNCRNDSAIPNETNSFYVLNGGDSVRVELQLINCTYQSDCFWTEDKPLPSGLKNDDYENSVSIFPNPTSGDISVNSTSELLKLDLFDLTGNKVTEVVPFRSNMEWSLPINLPNGIYLVSFEFNNGMKINKKLILLR